MYYNKFFLTAIFFLLLAWGSIWIYVVFNDQVSHQKLNSLDITDFWPADSSFSKDQIEYYRNLDTSKNRLTAEERVIYQNYEEDYYIAFNSMYKSARSSSYLLGFAVILATALFLSLLLTFGLYPYLQRLLSLSAIWKVVTLSLLIYLITVPVFRYLNTPELFKFLALLPPWLSIFTVAKTPTNSLLGRLLYHLGFLLATSLSLYLPSYFLVNYLASEFTSIYDGVGLGGIFIALFLPLFFVIPLSIIFTIWHARKLNRQKFQLK